MSGCGGVFDAPAPPNRGVAALRPSHPGVLSSGHSVSEKLDSFKLFPNSAVARGTTMPKRKPSQRRQPEKTPGPPRNRLAEIRAEIQDLQQQIETQRRKGHVLRTAEDFQSLERAIAAL